MALKCDNWLTRVGEKICVINIVVFLGGERKRGDWKGSHEVFQNFNQDMIEVKDSIYWPSCYKMGMTKLIRALIVPPIYYNGRHFLPSSDCYIKVGCSIARAQNVYLYRCLVNIERKQCHLVSDGVLEVGRGRGGGGKRVVRGNGGRGGRGRGGKGEGRGRGRGREGGRREGGREGEREREEIKEEEKKKRRDKIE